MLTLPEVHVARPSGLLVAFDPPELTMDAAIRRGWQQDGRLLKPKAGELVKTTPGPVWHSWDWYWSLQVYEPGPAILGIPEV